MLLGRRRERATLDRLVEDVRAGQSAALVVRGEPGAGKSALLAYLGEKATGCRVARAAGVQSEMELTFAGLHQLCAPLLDHVEELPERQGDALLTSFGLSTGGVPERFLVGLAVLNLFSDAASEQPLVCLVDDAQWFDRASAQALGFVARRLQAESVAVVFGLRDSAEASELAALPELVVGGLADDDARELLCSVVQGPLDERVRDRIVAETGGNPLALLELPRGLSAAELAGGFGAEPLPTLPDRIEESFGRRLAALPEETRRLLLIAAAEPLGEPILVWGAAERRGIRAEAAAPATEAGLCEFGARIRFRHPLVRAVAYRAGSSDERRQTHAAIAEATDADADPDRRAWHLALAAAGPDDAVADELERSAARARARGGEAAAAAFLERSVDLTLDPARRAGRALAAGEAKHLAGSAEAALRLAAVAERGPLDELQRVRIDVLRGRAATMQRRGSDAPLLLLRAAQRLDRFDRRLARDTYRDALGAAYFADRLARGTGLAEVSAAVRTARPPTEPASAPVRLLDAAALLVDSGHATGAPAARRALAAFRAAPMPPEMELNWLWLACRISYEVWDDEAWDAVTARQLEVVRGTGALALLPMAVAMRVALDVLAGDLAVATARIVEQDAVVEAIGGERSPYARIAVAAFRGSAVEVARLDQATTRDAIARGEGQWLGACHWSLAVLFNGLGRYDEAVAAAQQGAAHPPDIGLASWALAELIEAAARCGRPEAAGDALARLGEMARVCDTDWILGVEARARALVANRGAAEDLHHQAVEHLGRTRLRTELARAHLVYGEWLRRENRRVDAREQLRLAHTMLSDIGADAFAERARRELLATGETVRKRTVETLDELTPQELQVARLAAGGHTNPEIGAQLFLSIRTVEWHLTKVYAKLGISSRKQLRTALPNVGAVIAGA